MQFLGRVVGKDCTVFWVNPNWKDCAIIEPNRLQDKIMQFLEGRLGALQNCTIFLGGCSAYS